MTNVYDAIQSALDAAMSAADPKAAQALRNAAQWMVDLQVSRQTKSDLLNRATTELEAMMQERDMWRGRAQFLQRLGRAVGEQTD